MTDSRQENRDNEALESLYRQAADAEPDGRIDDLVLEKARRAASRPRPRRLRHPGAWGVGIAAAASLVLAVGLFLQQGGPPEPQSMEQFRVKEGLQDADTKSEPTAPAMKSTPQAGESAGIRESEALQRDDAGAARAGQRAETENAEEMDSGVNEIGAERDLATPLPADEGRESTPEAWLERIHQLVNSGRLDEARHQIRRFREAHPSAEVPVEIREALASDPE